MWLATPLITAIQSSKLDISLLLLDVPEIDIEHTNEKGAGALVYACIEGFEVIVNRLISMDVNLNPKLTKPVYMSSIDKSLRITPLSAACVNGHQEIVLILAKSGCDINMPFSFSLTKSVLSNNNNKSNKVIKDPICLTPIALAIHYGKVSVVNVLLGLHARWKCYDSEQLTLLHHATRYISESTMPIISLLQSIGLFNDVNIINAVDIKGYTALHYACDNKSLEIVKILLSSNANVNMRSSSEYACGDTPLLIAIKRKHFGIVQVLLEYNSDIYLKNDSGVNAVLAADKLRVDSPIYQIIQKSLASQSTTTTTTTTTLSITNNSVNNAISTVSDIKQDILRDNTSLSIFPSIHHENIIIIIIIHLFIIFCFAACEAMYHLGIPTTRALAVYTHIL
jgi:ankyrin repeat protein